MLKCYARVYRRVLRGGGGSPNLSVLNPSGTNFPTIRFAFSLEWLSSRSNRNYFRRRRETCLHVIYVRFAVRYGTYPSLIKFIFYILLKTEQKYQPRYEYIVYVNGIGIIVASKYAKKRVNSCQIRVQEWIHKGFEGRDEFIFFFFYLLGRKKNSIFRGTP